MSCPRFPFLCTWFHLFIWAFQKRSLLIILLQLSHDLRSRCWSFASILEPQRFPSPKTWTPSRIFSASISFASKLAIQFSFVLGSYWERILFLLTSANAQRRCGKLLASLLSDKCLHHPIQVDRPSVRPWTLHRLSFFLLCSFSICSIPNFLPFMRDDNFT